MSRMEIIRSMSEDDALLALQAASADNIERSTAAMEAMSTEGLNAFISILKESIKQKEAQL